MLTSQVTKPASKTPGMSSQGANKAAMQNMVDEEEGEEDEVQITGQQKASKGTKQSMIVTHAAAHNVELAANDSLLDIAIVHDIQQTIQELYKRTRISAKKRDKVTNVAKQEKLEEEDVQLAGHHGIRWLAEG